MNRFFDEPFLDAPHLLSPQAQEFALALDVKEEDDDAYIVKASVPGVPPENVDVTISDNVLTLKGESSEEKEVHKTNYHLRERRFGSFSRSLTLPAAVESDMIEATQENGVLTLRLPKSEKIQPKKIAIQTATNGAAK